MKNHIVITVIREILCSRIFSTTLVTYDIECVNQIFIKNRYKQLINVFRKQKTITLHILTEYNGSLSKTVFAL